MPRCEIDDQASSSFLKLVSRLSKKYRNISDDLADTFAKIGREYESACNAVAIPGFEKTVWKYRCRSRDMARGSRGGFRIIAYYDRGTSTLYPFLIYPKVDIENMSTDGISKALSQLRNDLLQQNLPGMEEE